jgi:hypothetical protein
MCFFAMHPTALPDCIVQLQHLSKLTLSRCTGLQSNLILNIPYVSSKFVFVLQGCLDALESSRR